jgi:hypothetical protein
VIAFTPQVQLQSVYTIQSSAHAVGAGGEEIEEAEVAEDLELLADFVADVGVVGMEFGQGAGVGVDVGESEFEFA